MHSFLHIFGAGKRKLTSSIYSS